MPINQSELLQAAELVAQNENLKANLSCSLEGAAVTGASTLVGGILAGPIGLAIGAILGGVTSAIKSSGKFKSVVTIIQGLSPSEKARLAYHVSEAVKKVDHSDVIFLASIVLTERGLYSAVLSGVKQFITSDMNMVLS